MSVREEGRDDSLGTEGHLIGGVLVVLMIVVAGALIMAFA
jgi:hypothetical protein